MKSVIIAGLAVAAVVGSLEAAPEKEGSEREGKPSITVGSASENVVAYAGRLWTVVTDAGGVTEVRSVAPKPAGDFHIPSKLGTTEITRIGERAFCGCDKLEFVWISAGITEIDKEAFSACSNLKCVRLPDSIRKIGAGAFFCTGLTSVMIPMGVESIGHGAFSGCKDLARICVEESCSRYRMENGYLIGSDRSLLAFERKDKPEVVEPPEGVVSICNYAFYGISSLKTVRLQSDLSRIECDAFKGCTGIATVEVKGESVEVAAGEIADVSMNAFDANVMKLLPKNNVSTNRYLRLVHGEYKSK